MQYLAAEGLFDSGLRFRPMVLPDLFLDQDKPELQYATAGLDARHIVATALSALGLEKEAAEAASA